MAKKQQRRAPPDAPRPGLTLRQILALCGVFLALVTGTGYLLGLDDIPLEIKVSLTVAVVLVIWVVFPWLWNRRNPDARARRKGGLYLLMGGFTLLSSLLFAGFKATFDVFGNVIAFELLLQGAWWTDVIFGVSPLFMFFFGYRLLRPPKVETRREEEPEAEEEKAAETRDFVRPEAYRPPKRLVFWVRVRKLFELKSYNRYRDFGDLNEASCIVGKQYADEGDRTVVIRCDDRGVPVQKEEVNALLTHARRVADKAASPALRTFYVVPASDVLREVDQAAFSEVSFKTEEQLLNELIHFEPYLRKLRDRYEVDKLPYSLLKKEDQKTLSQTYVLPRFSLSEGTWDRSLDAYLENWLQEPGARHLVLLGDYGMGKSSFVTHFAAHRARAWLGGDQTGRIPLLLELGGSSPRNDPGAKKLLAGFIDDNRLGCTTEALRYLMREERIVVLLDGFDEMDLIGDKEQRRRHFEELWSLAEHGNKVMISGRPGYFPKTDELANILMVANQAAKQGTGARYCTRINLELFEPDDIKEAFHKYFDSPEKADRYLGVVSSQKELADLARRPALMHIIRDTLTVQLAEGATFDTEGSVMKPAALLRTYTEHWLIRDIDKPRILLIKDEDRLRFSEELAAWMMMEDRAEVTSDELFEQYKTWFPDDPRLETDSLQILEGLKADLRTCTFMVPVGDQGFKFAHMPFLEYFVAAWVVDHLVGGRKEEDLPTAFLRRPWRHEIARHVADLLLDVVERGALSRLLHGRLYMWSATDSLFAILFARKNVPDKNLQGSKALEVSGLHSPLFNMTQVQLYAGIPFRNTLLHARLVDTWWRRFNTSLRSMARRYMMRLPKAFGLRQSMVANFSDVRTLQPLLDYRGADLQGAYLREADLQGAYLQRANLQGADLQGANLQGANLEATVVSVAQLAKARSLMGAQGISEKTQEELEKTHPYLFE